MTLQRQNEEHGTKSYNLTIAGKEEYNATLTIIGFDTATKVYSLATKRGTEIIYNAEKDQFNVTMVCKNVYPHNDLVEY